MREVPHLLSPLSGRNLIKSTSRVVVIVPSAGNSLSTVRAAVEEAGMKCREQVREGNVTFLLWKPMFLCLHMAALPHSLFL